MTQEAWDQEYLEGNVPSSRKRPLSVNAIEFIRFLEKQGKIRKILDIGCGDGQNTEYFSTYADEVEAFDFSEKALQIAPHNPKIRYIQHDATLPWPYLDNQFDAAFDGATFINMVTEQQINHYLTEIRRVLKQRGVYHLVTPIIPDQFYSELRTEQGIIVTHGKGIVQRTYTLDELCKILEKQFEIINQITSETQNTMYGRTYRRTRCSIIMTKQE